MRYAVSAIECSSSVNGNGANEDLEGREREREKVAASLVRSFVANLFAPPFPRLSSVSLPALALGMQEKRLSRLLTAKGVVILRGLQEEVLG